MPMRTLTDIPLDAVKSIATVKLSCVLSKNICIENSKQKNQHFYYHERTILLRVSYSKAIATGGNN